MNNLILYNSFIYILNVSSAELFHIDKIKQILIFERHYGPASQFGRR